MLKNIVVCADYQNIHQADICLKSLFLNLPDSKKDRITVYFVAYNFPAELAVNYFKRFKVFNTFEFKLIIIDNKFLNDYAQLINNIRVDSPSNTHSVRKYLKFLLPNILPERVEWCLYLDVDSLVLKSLDKLLELPLDPEVLIYAPRDHQTQNYLNSLEQLEDSSLNPTLESTAPNQPISSDSSEAKLVKFIRKITQSSSPEQANSEEFNDQEFEEYLEDTYQEASSLEKLSQQETLTPREAQLLDELKQSNSYIRDFKNLLDCKLANFEELEGTKFSFATQVDFTKPQVLEQESPENDLDLEDLDIPIIDLESDEDHLEGEDQVEDSQAQANRYEVFSSDLMILNIKEFRNRKYLDQYFEYLTSDLENLPYDNLYLNLVHFNQWKALPDCFSMNAETLLEVKDKALSLAKQQIETQVAQEQLSEAQAQEQIANQLKTLEAKLKEIPASEEIEDYAIPTVLHYGYFSPLTSNATLPYRKYFFELLNSPIIEIPSEYKRLWSYVTSNGFNSLTCLTKKGYYHKYLIDKTITKFLV